MRIKVSSFDQAGLEGITEVGRRPFEKIWAAGIARGLRRRCAIADHLALEPFKPRFQCRGNGHDRTLLARLLTPWSVEVDQTVLDLLVGIELYDCLRATVGR
ncbi:hypothetical protein D3Y57_01650 (plasmid) [Sphingomonas paeninsulae]|uniref:Uncharacterized protein n=1 Tax=Sphingomonas paeninsulae TaxID=2319844 RepID=A0A494TI24_SPHPE|nr:hypothetical protein D3Y57_01650 [Sphingomonas paeninsulae]